MNNISKISKYLLRDNSKSLLIFYSIILVIGLFLLSILMNPSFEDELEFGGFGVSAAIFLFIVALNSFKVNYKFMQSFNISRKRFYIASVIALITLALIMSVVDVMLNNVFDLLAAHVGAFEQPAHVGIFEQLYGNNFFIHDFFWSFAFFIYVASLGWLITLIYYRCNKVMKVVISIIPVLGIILLTTIDNITSIDIWKGIGNFIAKILGLTNGLNSYIAVITFIIGAIICFSLSFLLIRRVTIKE